LKEILTTVHRA